MWYKLRTEIEHHLINLLLIWQVVFSARNEENRWSSLYFVKKTNKNEGFYMSKRHEFRHKKPWCLSLKILNFGMKWKNKKQQGSLFLFSLDLLFILRKSAPLIALAYLTESHSAAEQVDRMRWRQLFDLNALQITMHI